MLSVQEAESLILNLVQSPQAATDAEVVELSAAVGRILASPVTSELDFPLSDNSAMDGYAVRYADVQSCTEQQPTTLEIVAEIPAGYQPQLILQPGQAARIFTGACLPEGADTVVMQENTRREENKVLIFQSPEPQAFVRHRASFYQAGKPLLIPGITLRAPEIAVLAAAQSTQFRVYRRPRVAILSTGNELVRPDQPLQPGKIVDSNQYALAAFVAGCGALPVPLGIIPDQPEALKTAISKALSTTDLVLSTGGVSVGDYDYVEQILAELGGQIQVRAVAMKPGKPLTVAAFRHQGRQIVYFGLPGNPVSALVSCWRFVQLALNKLAGKPQEFWQPQFVKATTRNELRSGGKRETYSWGQLQLNAGVYQFQAAAGSQSSGNLINLAQTTGLAMIPIGQTFIPAGEQVQVLRVASTP